MGARPESRAVQQHVDRGWPEYEWPWPGRRVAAAKMVRVFENIYGEPTGAMVELRGCVDVLPGDFPTQRSSMRYMTKGYYAVVCRDGTRTFVPASAIESARRL